MRSALTNQLWVGAGGYRPVSVSRFAEMPDPNRLFMSAFEGQRFDGSNIHDWTVAEIGCHCANNLLT